MYSVKYIQPEFSEIRGHFLVWYVFSCILLRLYAGYGLLVINEKYISHFLNPCGLITAVALKRTGERLEFSDICQKKNRNLGGHCF